MVALKYLYSYCAIFSIDLKSMSKADTSGFISFLLGYSVDGIDVSLKFNTFRSTSTVNSYLSAIRSYLNYLEIKKHPLLETTGRKTLSTSYREPTYKSKLRTFNRKNIPVYIKQEEFVFMIKKCHEKKDLRMECIIRLMYQSGLRIGEVLGLTFEDIVEDNSNYKVIIRNRFTDKTFQKAKFLMTVTDRNQYKSRDYSLEWYGWNEMAITADMYECLIEYIEQAHTPELEHHLDKWNEKIKTDTVTNTFDEDNFYIFINKHHAPLSNKTLENEIEKLFKECNIPLNNDRGKKDGLAHRFRHGFAMYQVNVNNLDKLRLSKLMRHRNIESCEVYYTPEISEIIRIKNDISETVYDLLPRFELDE